MYRDCESIYNPNGTNGGFEEGLYDYMSVWPSSSNNIRQSKFEGPQIPALIWCNCIDNDMSFSSFVVGKNKEVYFGTEKGYVYKVGSDSSLIL